MLCKSCQASILRGEKRRGGSLSKQEGAALSHLTAINKCQGTSDDSPGGDYPADLGVWARVT